MDDLIQKWLDKEVLICDKYMSKEWATQFIQHRYKTLYIVLNYI